MNRISLGIIGVVTLVLVIGIATNATGIRPDSSEPTPSATERASGLDVIARETDCGELQDTFDTSYEAHQAAEGNSNLPMMQRMTARMSAADDRMRDLGCYE